jgi:Zn-dependent peptidase ImmA (M78 family)
LSTFEIGEYEGADISAQVRRVLTDLGNPEPPLILGDVRTLLKLDLQYYNSSNHTALKDLAHKIRVGGKKILARPTLIFDVIKKVSLSALWIPDRRRILLDDSVPSPKLRWNESHEIGHSLIPWHQQYLFGDNKFTLDPACHAQVEAESNFAAAQLLFLQDRFLQDSRDLELNWTAIKRLTKRYQNTLTTTLWRMVESRDPNHPVVGLISRHPRHPEIGSNDDGTSVRHFMYSSGFHKRFGSITAQVVFEAIKTYVTWSSKGPVGQAEIVLFDCDKEKHIFQLSSFCNGHDLLTFGTMIR